MEKQQDVCLLIGKIHREGWIIGAPSWVKEPSTSPSGLWLHIPGPLLDLTTRCSCAGVLRAPGSALLSPCPPPPETASNASAPWHLCLPFKPLLRNADAEISTECPQVPTLAQSQALHPSLSHICLLNRRGLPVKLLQPLHIILPSLAHYQPNWLMRSKTSTKPSKIWITLRSMLPLQTLLPKEVPTVTLFPTCIIKSLISLQLLHLSQQEKVLLYDNKY